MKSILFSAVLVFAATALAAEYPASVKKELYATNDLRGKKAPEITGVKWLTKAPETKDKILVIDFWATWCPPCRATIPELGEWQKKYAKDIAVIGISAERADVVKGFMAKTDMPYSVGVDAERHTESKVGVKGIPHVLVVTPDGVVRWQGFPLQEDDKLTSEKLEQIIAAWKSGQR